MIIFVRVVFSLKWCLSIFSVDAVTSDYGNRWWARNQSLLNYTTSFILKLLCKADLKQKFHVSFRVLWLPPLGKQAWCDVPPHKELLVGAPLLPHDIDWRWVNDLQADERAQLLVNEGSGYGLAGCVRLRVVRVPCKKMHFWKHVRYLSRNMIHQTRPDSGGSGWGTFLAESMAENRWFVYARSEIWYVDDK